jgi:hypothetical protein
MITKQVYLTVKFKSNYLNKMGKLLCFQDEPLISFLSIKQAKDWVHIQPEHHREFTICSVEEVWGGVINMKREILDL